MKPKRTILCVDDNEQSLSHRKIMLETRGYRVVSFARGEDALERFTQGLAQEVAPHNVAVSALSPSQVVATPGTIYHRIATGMDDPRTEPPAYMARAALVLASEPVDKVNGRVTYSQQILGEYGLIDKPTGRGVTSKGSGYSQI